VQYNIFSNWESRKIWQVGGSLHELRKEKSFNSKAMAQGCELTYATNDILSIWQPESSTTPSEYQSV